MYQQIQLPYAYDALEPHIDALTMETHYTKHHAAYTKNLNEAAEKAGVASQDIVALLSNLDQVQDEALRRTIRNNGGGFYNHNLYFATMAPNAGGEPGGTLAAAIKAQLGGFEDFKNEIARLGGAQFGSSWAWLSAKKDGTLALSSTPNQDNPLMDHKGFTPILGIDVWEHAYYLKYKNLRPDYIKAFFNVINWKAVEENYERALKG